MVCEGLIDFGGSFSYNNGFIFEYLFFILFMIVKGSYVFIGVEMNC